MDSVDCDLKHSTSFTCVHTCREESYSRRFPCLWAAAHLYPHGAGAMSRQGRAVSRQPSPRRGICPRAPGLKCRLNSQLRAFLEGSAAYQCHRRPPRQEAAGGTKPLVQHTHWYLPSWDSLKHALHFPAAPLQTVSPRRIAGGGGEGWGCGGGVVIPLTGPSQRLLHFPSRFDSQR